MLVTNGGQLIRCPVEGIRVAGRATQGVTVFKTASDERVVSVERISEDDAGSGEGENGDAGEAETAQD
jgi:DNA gyrase subunit A